MLFLYRYQDRERGVLEGEIAASSEANAYAALRKSGVRPMKVWAKPGFANRLSALGKRGLAIVILALVAIVSMSVALNSRRELQKTRSALTSLPRQQLPETSVAFAYVSEQTLAAFVRPGDLSRVEAMGDDAAVLFPDLATALKNAITKSADDTPEAVMLKRVVVELKEEARTAITGGRSPKEFLEFLVMRQRMEADYRDSVLRDVRIGRVGMENGNALLRRYGLREIPLNFFSKSSDTPLTSNQSF